MLSIYNDDSTTSNSSKNVSNKIKILSQTLLRAANLTSRKELLNQALGGSDLNKFVKSDAKSKVISKQLFKDDEDGEKSNASANHQDKVTKNIKSKKQNRKVEEISDSSDEEELNNNLSQSKKAGTKSDLDSSAELERAMNKTQVSKLDISGPDKRNNKNKYETSIKNKIKDKKQEVISDSSLSEQEYHNSKKNVKGKMQQKKEEILSSSDSESDKSKRDIKERIGKNKSRRTKSSMADDESSSSSDNEKAFKNVTKKVELKKVKSSDTSRRKSSKAKSESRSSICGSDVDEKNQSVTSQGKSPTKAGVPNTVAVRKQKENKYNVSSCESESDNENKNKKSTLKDNKSTTNGKNSKLNEKRHNTSKQEAISSSTSDSDTQTKCNNNKNKKTNLKESSSETSRSRNSSPRSNNSRWSSSSRSRSSSTSSNRSRESSISRNKSRSAVYSSGSESDSSKDIKTNKKRSSSSSSPNSDSEDNKKGKKTQSSSNKLKRKYSDMKSSDDSSDDDRRANKKRKQANTTPMKKVSEADKLLDNFLNENQCKLVKSKQLAPLDTLGKDEEMYLLQLSKNIDPLLLIDKTISFDGPSKLKLENKSYISDVNTNSQYDINIMNFTNLVNLKPKGVITIQPRTKSVNSSFEMRPVNDILEVPKNLKMRHPLFGTDYEEKIKLDEDIENKLNEIVISINKKHKKKSKKKRRELRNVEDGVARGDRMNEKDDISDVIRLLNEHIGQAPEEQKDQKKKKKSKHKAKDCDDIISQMQNEADSILTQMLSDLETPKKKRKDRSSQHSSDTKENNISSHSLHDPIDDDYTQPKKKKKKKHKDSMELGETMTSTPNILNQDEGKAKKNKKHSSKEFIFNTPDIIQKVSKKEKENKKDKEEEKIKKKHAKRFVNSTMFTSAGSDSILQLDESCIPKAKTKKHRHKHSIETEDFIDDLLKDVNVSQETSPNKKKKHKKKHSIQ